MGALEGEAERGHEGEEERGMEGTCTEGLLQACHDIRQPVAGVLALAGAALAEADLPVNVRACLNQIVGLAEWQSDVIDGWLQGPADEPDDAPRTEVVRAVNEAIAVQRVTWAGEMTLVWPPEPVFVPLRTVAMRRMAANLLANATRAATPSGKVTVEVSRRGSWILLVVEDSGPGFGRLPGGSGLGLTAVARQAAEHQGRLECGRGSLGGGQVSLWLPAVASRTGERVADAACAV
jgi:signal transduction histidine kinase